MFAADDRAVAILGTRAAARDVLTASGEGIENGCPYSSLTDPADVAAGSDFTAAQKEQIINANIIRNGGIVRSDSPDDPYDILFKPQKSSKGVTPLPYEWQIDHIVPRVKGGSNSYSNAQVISRAFNRTKFIHSFSGL